METGIIYPTLVAEMAKRRIKQKQLSMAIGISYKAFFNKLRGITAFTWDEVTAIREQFFPDMSSDELFRRQG